MNEELTCIICNKKFLHKKQQHKKKFCSKICYHKWFVIRNPRRSEKVCFSCGETKNYKLFRYIKSSKNGWMDIENKPRYTHCKTCEVINFRKRYAINSSAQLIYNYKKRAIKKGVPFDLDAAYLSEIMPKDMICPVMKVPMTRNTGKKIGKNRFAPSLDKLIPEKGYVKGNVIVVSDIANRIKSDATIEELEKTYLFYREFFKKNKI
jgi:hypothetical protein